MEFNKTQLGRVLEQVKQAILAQTPVVYIPTDQIEIIHKLLYGNDCIDSLVPRVSYDTTTYSIKKLKFDEIGDYSSSNGSFTSITDNYQIGVSNPDSIRIPSILVSYVTDWTNIISSVRDFIAIYNGIKKSKNQTNPSLTDAVKRSIYIVVTPKEEIIPASVAPYIKTVRIPALCDEEIEEIISNKLKENDISHEIINSQLLSQMIVSFRGFSTNKITQMMNLMIAQQSIDFDDVDSSSIISIIRTEKKQMLDNNQGLKWENSSISDVAGLDAISLWLKNRKSIFEDPNLARSQHMDIPKGVLISGIPGSGKSLMAKTAANILNMPLISLDMGALLGSLMGESEHNMINALTMAEQMSPCVLWIDEIEKAFSGSSQNSSSNDGGVGRRMFGKFLTWMQEKSAACFVFATSNDITSLPPELFRSERFDCKFFTFMPTATECAEIFAANIKAQNKAYQKDLANIPARLKALQAKQLFDHALESPSFWLKIINECCTHDLSSCTLKNVNEELTDEKGNNKQPIYSWSTTSRPKNKLMTGADISALIKEAKFRIQSQPMTSNIPSTIYNQIQMNNAVREIMKSNNFKPYGETNLKDIAKCFLKLHENEFEPASGQCILDFDCYDNDKHIYIHDSSIAKEWSNNYDRVLYYTLVGAINHYSKEIRNL